MTPRGLATASGFPPVLMAATAIPADTTIPEGLVMDPDADDTFASLTIAVTGLPTTVSYDGATRTFSGTPDEDNYGPHTITVTATDTSSATDSETFELTVNRRDNRNPVATADTNTALENAGVTATGNVLTDGTRDSDPDIMVTAGTSSEETFTVTGYNAGDAFDGSNLTPAGMLLTNTATSSTLTIAAGGAYTYTVGTGHEQLAHDGTTTEVFWYQITDSRMGTANASLTISITGENDAPTAGGTLDVDEDMPHSFAVTDFAFRDVDAVSENGADALASVNITTLPVTAGTTTAAGRLELDNAAVTVGQVIPAADIPKLVFTPANRSAEYMATIGYTVTDDSGITASATSAAAVLTITVDADQDGPALTSVGESLKANGRSVAHQTTLIAGELPEPADLFEAVDEGDTVVVLPADQRRHPRQPELAGAYIRLLRWQRGAGTDERCCDPKLHGNAQGYRRQRGH